jgi:hypothetical protein
MKKGYRAYEQHLQINHTPAEYIPLKESTWGGNPEEPVAPHYLVSRCPFCGAARTACLDTYSVYRWTPNNMDQWGDSVGHADYDNEKKRACKHFVAIQPFLNLEGTVPIESSDFEAHLHLPFVMPFYLPDDMPSCAVIHSLPICRIEAPDNGNVFHLRFNRFVKPRADIQFLHQIKRGGWVKPTPFAEALPRDKKRLEKARFKRRYTGFIVSHYAEDPQSLRDRYIETQLTKNAIRDPDFTAADLFLVAWTEKIRRQYPDGFDLATWVEKGKLQWLDLADPNLPLKATSVEDFPYADLYDMTGRRVTYLYQSGDFYSSKYYD